MADVGANRGQFALVARHCFPTARIISFEPLQRPAAQFKVVFGADPNVTLHQVAIGPMAGSTMIHVSRQDDSSSLLAITERQEELFPGTDQVQLVEARIAPLTDFVKEDAIVSPALLKLDVQGYEMQALEGCEPLLGRFTYVYAECSFQELYAGQALADEIIAWLRDHYFRLIGIYNLGHDGNGQAVQADLLFQSNAAP